MFVAVSLTRQNDTFERNGRPQTHQRQTHLSFLSLQFDEFVALTLYQPLSRCDRMWSAHQRDEF